MPGSERLVLCGGAESEAAQNEEVLRLDLSGPNANVRLAIKNVPKHCGIELSDTLTDLLEIASYIDAADSAIPRGPGSEVALGQDWKRAFRFVIPIRNHDFWSSDQTVSSLTKVVGFLSGDDYQFEFRARSASPHDTSHISYSKAATSEALPNEIVLFSGGLDSLAGTVELLASYGKTPALICLDTDHKSKAAQSTLQGKLRKRFGQNRALPISAAGGLKSNEVVEHTHRTRSFLLASIGAVVGQRLNLNRLRFFGNGVASLNLFTPGQVIGARAARANHPQALSNISSLLSQVLGKPWVVSNPYIWNTKSEVICRIIQAGCADLIGDSWSCTRVLDVTKERLHCGLCMQCIDRKFALAATGQEPPAPRGGYGFDFFVDPRGPGSDSELALTYVRSSLMVQKMRPLEIAAQFGAISRITAHFNEPRANVEGRVFQLFPHHANTVSTIYKDYVNSNFLKHGVEFPDRSLLRLLALRSDHRPSYPPSECVLEQRESGRTELYLRIDEATGKVRFVGLQEFDGKIAKLLKQLAEKFRQDWKDKLEPSDFRFTSTNVLVDAIRFSSDTHLRQEIWAFRKAIAKKAIEAGHPALETHTIIESNNWKGYRLNPDHVRLDDKPGHK